MKLKKEEIARPEDTSPLQLFSQGIKTDLTRRKYTATLRRIMCDILEDILEGDFEERTKQFVQLARDNPERTTTIMLKMSQKLRDRTMLAKDDPDYLNPTSLPAYFKPIKKLFDMNDVSISLKRVYATFPENDNMHDAKGWTRDEIAGILEHARDPMDKAMVLMLASSGIRLGGLELTWGDITPVYMVDGKLTADPGKDGKVACAALNVYAGSPENYTAFITYEAYRALQAYGRVWQDLMKCAAGPKDPIFLAGKLLPRPIKTPAIAMRIRRMADKAGLRDRDSKNGPRYGTQLVHGFRKFFNKTCKETLSGDPVASITRIEYMMGHQGLVKLDQNYFKTSMLEMAATYLKAAPDLTISDAERLKRSADRMKANIQELEEEQNGVVADLKNQVEDLRRKNLMIADTLERVKAERDGAANADSKLVADLARRLQSQDEAMKKMRAEHSKEMRDMSVMVDKLYSVIRDEVVPVNSRETETRTGPDGKPRKIYARHSWKSDDLTSSERSPADEGARLAEKGQD